MPNRKPTLVVIDDDIDIAEIIGQIGSQAGFDVQMVTDPDTLYEDIDTHGPVAIVLDLQMPKLDGIQVLRGLAQRKIKAGIILVTGMDERTIAAAELYGTERGLKVLATVQKPFSPEDLLETLLAARAATGPLTVDDLRKAIDDERLLVYYQPTVVRRGDGTWDIQTMEALLRWDHPDRGILSPDAFLAMGEKSGLIRPMTDYVIQRGLEQLRAWQSSGMRLGLRINISASLLTDLDFPDRFERLMEELETDPAGVTMEITETAMLEQHADTFDILTRFRLKRLNLAIDDFGIGYSSLTQLFRMPFNEMKIDKSLMLRAPQSSEAKIMIDALVSLAHNLNLTVCAEGVESRESLEFLDGIGCDSAQGFYISKPIAAKDVPEMISLWYDGQRRSQQRRAASEA
jgi:EAL domain-containing protein (putative c-di-GMP-specific phosphodiesterase class I)/FixJ family two-component response regulator